ncbi:methyltransferase domain-containing protein, partial [Candidatus Omnitrophota bacterium]
EEDANGIITVTEEIVSSSVAGFDLSRTTGLGQLIADMDYTQLAQALVDGLGEQYKPEDIAGWVQIDIRDLGSQKPTKNFLEQYLGRELSLREVRSTRDSLLDREDPMAKVWRDHKKTLPDIIRAKLKAIINAFTSKNPSEVTERDAINFYNIFASIENVARRYNIESSDYFKVNNGRVVIDINQNILDKDRMQNVIEDPVYNDTSGLRANVSISHGSISQRTASLYIDTGSLPACVEFKTASGRADLRGRELIIRVKVPDEFVAKSTAPRNGIEASAISQGLVETTRYGDWIDVIESSENQPCSTGFIFVVDEANRLGNGENWITVRMRFPDQKNQFDTSDPENISHIGVRFSLGGGVGVKFDGTVEIKDIIIRNAPTTPNAVIVEDIDDGDRGQDAVAPRVVTYAKLTRTSGPYNNVNNVIENIDNLPQILGEMDREKLVNAVYRALINTNGRGNKVDAGDIKDIIKDFPGTLDFVVSRISSEGSSAPQSIDSAAVEALIFWTAHMRANDINIDDCQNIAALEHVSTALSALRSKYSLEGINKESVDRIIYLVVDLAVKVNKGELNRDEAAHQAHAILKADGKEVGEAPLAFTEKLQKMILWGTGLLVAVIGLVSALLSYMRAKTAEPFTKTSKKSYKPKASVTTSKSKAKGKTPTQLSSTGQEITEIRDQFAGVGLKKLVEGSTAGKAMDMLTSINDKGAKDRYVLAAVITFASLAAAIINSIEATLMNFSTVIGAFVVASWIILKLHQVYPKAVDRFLQIVGIYSAAIMISAVDDGTITASYIANYWPFMVFSIAILAVIFIPMAYRLYLNKYRNGVSAKRELAEAQVQYQAMNLVLESINDMKAGLNAIIKDLQAESKEEDLKRLLNILNNLPNRVEFPGSQQLIEDPKAYDDAFVSLDISRIETTFLIKEAARAIVAIKGSFPRAALSAQIKALKEAGVEIGIDPDNQNKIFFVTPASDLKEIIISAEIQLTREEKDIIAEYAFKNSGQDKNHRRSYQLDVLDFVKFRMMRVVGPEYRYLKYKQEPTFDQSEEERLHQTGGTVLGVFGDDQEMPGSAKYQEFLVKTKGGHFREGRGENKKHMGSELFAYKAGYNLNLAEYCMDIELFENLKPGKYKEGIKERAERIGFVSEHEDVLDSMASRIPLRERYDIAILVMLATVILILVVARFGIPFVQGFLEGCGGSALEIPYLGIILSKLSALRLSLDTTNTLGGLFFKTLVGGGFFMMVFMIQPLKFWLMANGAVFRNPRTAFTENEVLSVQELRRSQLLRQAREYGIAGEVDKNASAVDIENAIRRASKRRASKLRRISIKNQAKYLGTEATEVAVNAAWDLEKGSIVLQVVEMLTRREEELETIKNEISELADNDEDAFYDRYRCLEQESGGRTYRTIEDFQWGMLNEWEERELFKSILDLYYLRPEIWDNRLFMNKNFGLSLELKKKFIEKLNTGKIQLRPETVRMLEESTQNTQGYIEELTEISDQGKTPGFLGSKARALRVAGQNTDLLNSLVLEKLKEVQDLKKLTNMSICVFLAQELGERRARALANKLVPQITIARPTPPLGGQEMLIDRVYRHGVIYNQYPNQEGARGIIARLDTDSANTKNLKVLAEAASGHSQLGVVGAAQASFQPVPIAAQGASGAQIQPLSKPGSNDFGCAWTMVRAMYSEFNEAANNKTVIPDMWEILDEDNYPQRFHYWAYGLLKRRKDTLVQYLLEEMRVEKEEGAYTYDIKKLTPKTLKRESPKLYQEVLRWGIKLNVATEIARDWNIAQKQLRGYKRENDKHQGKDIEASQRYETRARIIQLEGQDCEIEAVYNNFDQFLADAWVERESVTVIQGNPLQMPYGENKSFFSDYNIWGTVKFGIVAYRHPITFVSSITGIITGIFALSSLGTLGIPLFVFSIFGSFFLGVEILKLGLRNGSLWAHKYLPKRSIFHLDGLSNCFVSKAMFGIYTDNEGRMRHTKSYQVQEILLAAKRRADARRKEIEDEIAEALQDGNKKLHQERKRKAPGRRVRIADTMRSFGEVSYLIPMGPHPADDTTEDKHLGIRLVMTKREVSYCTDMGSSVFENAGPVNKDFFNQRSRWINPVSNGTVFGGKYRFLAPFMGAFGAGLLGGALVGPASGVVLGMIAMTIGFFAGFYLWYLVGNFIMYIQVRRGVRGAVSDVIDPVKRVGLANFLSSRNLDCGVEATYWTDMFFLLTAAYFLSFVLMIIFACFSVFATGDPTFGFASQALIPLSKWISANLPATMWMITSASVGVGLMALNFASQVVGNIWSLFYNKIGGKEKIRIGYRTYYNGLIGKFEGFIKKVESGSKAGDPIVTGWTDSIKAIEDLLAKDKNAELDRNDLLEFIGEKTKQDKFVATMIEMILKRSKGKEIPKSILRNLADELEVALVSGLEEMVTSLKRDLRVFSEGLYLPGLPMFLTGLLTLGATLLFASTPSWVVFGNLAAAILMSLPIVLGIAAKFTSFEGIKMPGNDPDVTFFYLYYTARAFNMPFYHLGAHPARGIIMGQIGIRQDNRWPYTDKRVLVSIQRSVEKIFLTRSREYKSISGLARESIGEKVELAQYFMSVKGWRGVRTYGIAVLTIVGLCYLRPIYQALNSATKARRSMAPLMDQMSKMQQGSTEGIATAMESAKEAFPWSQYWWIVPVAVFTAAIVYVYARKILLRGKLTAEGDRRIDYRRLPVQLLLKKQTKPAKSSTANCHIFSFGLATILAVNWRIAVPAAILLAAAVVLIAVKLIFSRQVQAHAPPRNILELTNEEILNLARPGNGELKKHSAADFKFASVIARALGYEDDSEFMNKLRAICFGHDIGGVLGNKKDDELEDRLIDLARENNIAYLGREPGEVAAEFKKKKVVRLSSRVKRFIRIIDHPNNSVRIFDEHNIELPDQVRLVISRHHGLPNEKELASLPRETIHLFFCQKVADMFEFGNNAYKKQQGLRGATDFESPEQTLAFINKEEFELRPSFAQFMHVVEELVAAKAFDQAIAYSNSSIKQTEFATRQFFARQVQAHAPPAGKVKLGRFKKHVNPSPKEIYTLPAARFGQRVNIVDLWIETLSKALNTDRIVICFVGTASKFPMLGPQYWKHVGDIDMDIFVPAGVEQDVNRVQNTFRDIAREKGLNCAELADEELFGPKGIFDFYIKSFEVWGETRQGYFEGYRYNNNYFGTASGLRWLSKVVAKKVDAVRLYERYVKRCGRDLEQVKGENLKELKTLVGIAIHNNMNLARRCVEKYAQLEDAKGQGALSADRLRDEILTLKQEFPQDEAGIRKYIYEAFQKAQRRKLPKDITRINPKKLISDVDPYVKSHLLRVAGITKLITEELGLPKLDRRFSRYCALLHDLGAQERVRTEPINNKEAFQRITGVEHDLSAAGRAAERLEPVSLEFDKWLQNKAQNYNIPPDHLQNAREKAADNDYYPGYELYIRYVLLNDKQLSQAEINVAHNLYSHGDITLEVLSNRNISYPEEFALVVKYHHDYHALDVALKKLVADYELSERIANIVRLVASTIIVADVFEQGNNYERIVENKGQPQVENFRKTFDGWMKKRFDEMENIGERRPLEALKALIGREDKKLFRIIAKARQSRELMPEDREFIASQARTVNSDWQTIMFAGGKGSRLKSQVPKPIVDVGGKPMAAHQILLFDQVAAKTTVLTGYKAEQVEQALRGVVAGRVSGEVAFRANPQGAQGTYSDMLAILDEVRGNPAKYILISSSEYPMLELADVQRLQHELTNSEAVAALLVAEVGHFDSPMRLTKNAAGNLDCIYKLTNSGSHLESLDIPAVCFAIRKETFVEVMNALREEGMESGMGILNYVARMGAVKVIKTENPMSVADVHTPDDLQAVRSRMSAAQKAHAFSLGLILALNWPVILDKVLDWIPFDFSETSKDFQMGCCPICGSVDGYPLHRIILRDNDAATGNSKEFIFVRCKHDNLVWMTPQPTRQAVKKMYNNSAYFGQDKEWTENPNTWKQLARYGYSTNYNRDERVEIFKGMLSKLMQEGHLTLSDEILDLGSGKGFMLDAAADLGWSKDRLYAVDLFEEAVAEISNRGLHAVPGDMEEEIPFSDKSFDVVTLFDVLEHVFQPLKVLKEAKLVLRNNHSRLIIRVPLYDAANPCCMSLEHISWFSNVGIVKGLLKQAGFEIIYTDRQDTQHALDNSTEFVTIVCKQSANELQANSFNLGLILALNWWVALPIAVVIVVAALIAPKLWRALRLRLGQAGKALSRKVFTQARTHLGSILRQASAVTTLKGRSLRRVKKCLFSVTRASAPTHSVYAVMNASAGFRPRSSYLTPNSNGTSISSSILVKLFMSITKFLNASGVNLLRTSSTINRGMRTVISSGRAAIFFRTSPQFWSRTAPRANIYSLLSRMSSKLLLPELFSRLADFVDYCLLSLTTIWIMGSRHKLLNLANLFQYFLYIPTHLLSPLSVKDTILLPQSQERCRSFNCDSCAFSLNPTVAVAIVPVLLTAIIAFILWRVEKARIPSQFVIASPDLSSEALAKEEGAKPACQPNSRAGRQSNARLLRRNRRKRGAPRNDGAVVALVLGVLVVIGVAEALFGSATLIESSLPFCLGFIALGPRERRQESNNLETWLNRAKVAESRGDMDATTGFYQKALQLDPENSAIHNNLGLAYHAKGSFTLAILHYRKALKFDHENAAIYNNLAILCQTMGEIHQVLKRTSSGLDLVVINYQRAIDLEPDDIAIRTNLADYLRATGDFIGAVREYGEIITRQPQNEKARYHLAEVEAKLSQRKEKEDKASSVLPIGFLGLGGAHVALAFAAAIVLWLVTRGLNRGSPIGTTSYLADVPGSATSVKDILSKTDQEINILCACKANFTRSQAMELSLRQLIRNYGLEDKIEVSSAGFAGRTRLSLPNLFLTYVAIRKGIDLDIWRSQHQIHLNKFQLQRADLIIIADREVQQAVKAMDASALNKSVLFGALDPESQDSDLIDPFPSNIHIIRNLSSLLNKVNNVFEQNLLPVLVERVEGAGKTAALEPASVFVIAPLLLVAMFSNGMAGNTLTILGSVIVAVILWRAGKALLEGLLARGASQNPARRTLGVAALVIGMLAIGLVAFSLDLGLISAQTELIAAAFSGFTSLALVTGVGEVQGTISTADRQRFQELLLKKTPGTQGYAAAKALWSLVPDRTRYQADGARCELGHAIKWEMVVAKADGATILLGPDDVVSLGFAQANEVKAIQQKKRQQIAAYRAKLGILGKYQDAIGGSKAKQTTLAELLGRLTRKGAIGDAQFEAIDRYIATLNAGFSKVDYHEDRLKQIQSIRSHLKALGLTKLKLTADEAKVLKKLAQAKVDTLPAAEEAEAINNLYHRLSSIQNALRTAGFQWHGNSKVRVDLHDRMIKLTPDWHSGLKIATHYKESIQEGAISSIVDLGAGTSGFWGILGMYGMPNDGVIDIDSSPEMYALAHNPNKHQSDITDMHTVIADNSCQLAVSMFVFDLLGPAQLKSAFLEANRLLQQGPAATQIGELAISLPPGYEFSAGCLAATEKLGLKLIHQEVAHNSLNPESVKKLRASLDASVAKGVIQSLEHLVTKQYRIYIFKKTKQIDDRAKRVSAKAFSIISNIRSRERKGGTIEGLNTSYIVAAFLAQDLTLEDILTRRENLTSKNALRNNQQGAIDADIRRLEIYTPLIVRGARSRDRMSAFVAAWRNNTTSLIDENELNWALSQWNTLRHFSATQLNKFPPYRTWYKGAPIEKKGFFDQALKTGHVNLSTLEKLRGLYITRTGATAQQLEDTNSPLTEKLFSLFAADPTDRFAAELMNKYCNEQMLDGDELARIKGMPQPAAFNAGRYERITEIWTIVASLRKQLSRNPDSNEVGNEIRDYKNSARSGGALRNWLAGNKIIPQSLGIDVHVVDTEARLKEIEGIVIDFRAKHDRKPKLAEVGNEMPDFNDARRPADPLNEWLKDNRITPQSLGIDVRVIDKKARLEEIEDIVIDFRAKHDRKPNLNEVARKMPDFKDSKIPRDGLRAWLKINTITAESLDIALGNVAVVDTEARLKEIEGIVIDFRAKHDRKPNLNEAARKMPDFKDSSGPAIALRNWLKDKQIPRQSLGI